MSFIDIFLFSIRVSFFVVSGLLFISLIISFFIEFYYYFKNLGEDRK